MPQFLFLGQRWINVDKITSVDMGKDPASMEPTCVVCCGSSKITLDQKESKEMLKWLAANKIKID